MNEYSGEEPRLARNLVSTERLLGEARGQALESSQVIQITARMAHLTNSRERGFIKMPFLFVEPNEGQGDGYFQEGFTKKGSIQ